MILTQNTDYVTTPPPQAPGLAVEPAATGALITMRKVAGATHYHSRLTDPDGDETVSGALATATIQHSNPDFVQWHVYDLKPNTEYSYVVQSADDAVSF